ncbi:MAG: NADH-quinone oxidoreductase subunit NuoH [Phycisphaerales bacterium]|nr:NADH-quinone oxidoreductase subunit NuoH [Phycisphaerales bacterium]
MREFLTSQFGVSVVLAVVVFAAMNGVVAYCIYYERKIAAWTQDRPGPNRVGPWGLLQPVADGLKFVFKEDVIPGHVDKPLYVLAPAAIFLVGFIGFAAIPWGGRLSLGGRLVEVQVANPDIGLLYILGVASMGVYGVVLGGWASNNKYSFYGGIRATAQMLSYEIPMGLCILVVVLTMGTLRLEGITALQTGYWLGWIPQWNVFLHPLAFLILFITALAESNRTPFDLAEAEQELVGGYHTEYSALKFGMFFLAEYGHMVTGSAFIAVLFLGGWHFPWFAWTQPEATQWYAVLAKMAVISVKIAAFLFVMMWIRWTLPRFRFDQLMRLAWKGLIPITLALFMLAAGLLYFGKHRSPPWALAGNAVILAVALVSAALSRTVVTGRQTNLPPVSLPAGRVGAGYASGAPL